MVDLFSKGLLSALEDETAHAYQPTHMRPDQIQTESGGRQFDANGKPLVGRYRSGKTPPKGQEAYGVAQMQIGTARATAAKHGIPWDQNRFMNERDYNLRLGDLHMGDLKAKYGDERLARAAYHSGEPRVDRAIARHGRENVHLGLGPEGRAYIGAPGGSGGARVAVGSASSVARAPDISTVTATDAERAAMADPDRNGLIVNPDMSAEGLRPWQQERVNRVGVAESVLQAALAEGDQVRAQQMSDLEKTVAAKRGVNDHQRQLTEELIKRSRPIFQKRQAILDRELEIDSMNPVEAAIKGIFNPNYNRKELRGTRALLNEQVEELNAAYEQDFKLHQTLGALSQADFTDQNQIYTLQMANLDEDVRNAVLSWESAGRVITTELDGLQQNAAVIQAQQVARGDIMRNLSDGQLNEAIAQADSGGGEVMVNGVKLRGQELLELRNTRQDRLINVEARQLAIESQRMQVAEHLQGKILDGFSIPELEKLIADGGVYQGQQFDVVAAGARLQQLQGVRTNQLQGLMTQSAAGAAEPMLRGLQQQTNAYRDRMIGIFGKIPEEFNSHAMTMGATMRQFIKGLNQATELGAGEEYLASNLPMIQGIIEQQNKTVESIVKRWSGGNVHVANVARAWIKGEQLDSGSAMRGLIHMARNGLPAGLQMTGPAARVFKVVQQEVAKPDNGEGNAADKENRLIQRIQSRVAATYNGNVLNQIVANVPEIAKGIMTDGRPHPASRINRDDWTAAVRGGDAVGLANVARLMGVSGETLLDIFKTGESHPQWQQRKPNLKPEEQNILVWKKLLRGEQTRAMFAELDKHQEEYGFRPSQAIANLFNNPQFLQAASGQTKIHEFGSFGGFVTAQASAGGVMTSLQNYADTIVEGYHVRRDNIASVKQQRIQELAHSPIRRAQFILGAVDGMSEDDEQKLLGALQAIPLPNASPGSGRYGAPNKSANAAYDQWILYGKSEDPVIERLRKQAAKTWQVLSGPVGRALDRDAER